MIITKEKLRQDEREKWQKRFIQRPGLLAEKLRQQPFYKKVSALYTTPSALFSQIRINALLDGKAVCGPSPGLKKGFYLVRPYQVPYGKIPYAVTLKGMETHGETLTTGDQAAGLEIGLMVVDCLALDRNGCIVGDGNGFVDLAAAIFSAWGKLAADPMIVTVAPQESIVEEDLAAEPWDCFADLLLTERDVLAFDPREKRKGWPLYWDYLPERRIRKITPLWKLYCLLRRNTGSRPHNSA